MAIIRLSIEILKGARDSDTPEERSAAVAELEELKRQVLGEEGIAVYPEDETAPWGVPRRPDTFNLDFDTNLSGEGAVDEACLDIVKAYVLRRP